MIANVHAPAINESFHLRVETKNNAPNKPYTIEGIPVNVSAVIRIIPTSLFPLFAYSTRYIAENIPIGAEKRSDNNVIDIVFIIAGIIDTFSELYSHANKSGVRFGIPLINI